jgi:hypothetical protein
MTSSIETKTSVNISFLEESPISGFPEELVAILSNLASEDYPTENIFARYGKSERTNHLIYIYFYQQDSNEAERVKIYNSITKTLTRPFELNL